jgi:meiosis arrest female protein 1
VTNLFLSHPILPTKNTQSNLQNSTINSSRFPNTRNDLNSTMHSTSYKSFSSLFDTSASSKQNQNKTSGSNSSGNSSGHSCLLLDETHPGDALSSEDDGGVYLQISNLDQWYDEASLRHYLMAQLKPITPILLLTIETPSIAKVKVPSVQVTIVITSYC